MDPFCINTTFLLIFESYTRYLSRKCIALRLGIGMILAFFLFTKNSIGHPRSPTTHQEIAVTIPMHLLRAGWGNSPRLRDLGIPRMQKPQNKIISHYHTFIECGLSVVGHRMVISLTASRKIMGIPKNYWVPQSKGKSADLFLCNKTDYW